LKNRCHKKLNSLFLQEFFERGLQKKFENKTFFFSKNGNPNLTARTLPRRRKKVNFTSCIFFSLRKFFQFIKKGKQSSRFLTSAPTFTCVSAFDANVKDIKTLREEGES
jgi:hypothetical protein